MSKKYFLIVTIILLMITATSWILLSNKPKGSKYTRATLVLHYMTEEEFKNV